MFRSLPLPLPLPLPIYLPAGHQNKRFSCPSGSSTLYLPLLPHSSSLEVDYVPEHNGLRSWILVDFRAAVGMNRPFSFLSGTKSDREFGSTRALQRDAEDSKFQSITHGGSASVLCHPLRPASYLSPRNRRTRYAIYNSIASDSIPATETEVCA